MSDTDYVRTVADNSMQRGLKIIDNIALEKLTEFGFAPDTHWFNSSCKPMLSYEFLGVDPDTRELCIGTGFDYLNGNLELVKFYDLMQAGLVEEKKNDNT